MPRFPLVMLRSKAERGRGTLVSLTPRGKEIVDEALDAHVANEERLLRSLAPAERRTLDDLLRRLLTDLEPDGHGPEPPA